MESVGKQMVRMAASLLPWGKPTTSAHNFRHGLTLLELSVSLLVVGLLIGGVVTAVDNKQTVDKKAVTIERLNAIVTAIENFNTRNARFPCVASQTVLDGDASFGQEVNSADCTYTSAPAGTARFETAASSGNWVISGAVPVRKIMLPDEYMQDGYGNRFTYVVMQDMTSRPTVSSATAALTVQDAGGNDIITDGAYVVFSHGEEGEGAYRYVSGAQIEACGSTNLDSENCDGDITFIDAPYNNGSVAASYFTDMIRWQSNTYYVTTYTPPPPPEPDNLGFRLDGAVASGKAGYAVATGDINGDGYRDVIIGTPGSGAEGFVHVVFGSDTGISLDYCCGTGTVSTLDGATGFRLDGLTIGDLVGTSVASGDVDNDNYDDIIIGAPNVGGKGAVYVVFGKTAWTNPTNTLDNNMAGVIDGTQGFALNGTVASGKAGWSVASGNINGDSYADVIIGAPDAASSAGYVYVVFGKTGVWTTSQDLDTSGLIDGTTGFRLDGIEEGGKAGYSVAGGNINGDSYDDLIIGSPDANNNLGYTYVVFGKTGAWSASTDLAVGGGGASGLLDYMVAYWAMDEASGNAVDATGSYDLTENNGVGTNTGKISNARDFTRAGLDNFSHVDTADLSAGANDFTISVWVYVTDTSGYPIIFSKGWEGAQDANSEYVLYLQSAIPRFAVRGSSTKILSATTGALSLNTWYHIVAWHRNGVEIGMSVNATATTPAAYTTGINDGTDPFYIGASPTQSLYFGGRIDEVAFWKGKVLDSTEISELYNSGSGVAYSSLAGASGFLNGTNGFRIDGVVSGGKAGYSVAGGNINNDSYDDIIIGAPDAASSLGYVYAVFGKASGWSATESLSIVSSANSLMTSMSAYWKMDEAVAGGYAYDAKGSSHLTDNATNVGNDTGKVGTARSFNGSSDYLYHADSPTLSTGDIDFTVAAWVQKDTAFGATNVIAAKQSSAAVREWSLYTASGVPTFIVADSGGTVVGTVTSSFGALSTGTPYYIVAWHDYDADTVNIQVNGGTVDSAATTGVPSDTAAVFQIGSTDAGTANHWGGWIDEVGFWKRTLTSPERTSLYNSGSGVAYDNLDGAGLIDGTTGFRIDGDAAETVGKVGYAVATGDINNDNYDDILIGAPYAGGGSNNLGYAYTVFGKAGTWSATPPTLATSDLSNGTLGFRLDGSVAGYAGFAVTAGDIDGDGNDEAIVGAYNANSSKGYVYGVYGTSTTWDPNSDLDTLVQTAAP